MTSLIYYTDMEEMISLGYIQLYKSNSYTYLITEEKGELLIGNIWGKLIFKIRYEDTDYALPIIDTGIWSCLNTEHGSRYFKSEILKYYLNLYTNNHENK